MKDGHGGSVGAMNDDLVSVQRVAAGGRVFVALLGAPVDDDASWTEVGELATAPTVRFECTWGDPDRPVTDLRHYHPQTIRIPLADIPTMVVERSAGLPVAAPHWAAPHWVRGADPDATRVAALADEEIAAWREILDGARSDG